MYVPCEADWTWARSITADLSLHEPLARVAAGIRREVTDVETDAVRGNLTVKLCHPEGWVKNVFFNDREIARRIRP